VVVSMQAIHLLKELGIRPKRTVRFVAWMSEEEGSQGAAAYMVTMARRRRTILGRSNATWRGSSGGDLLRGKPALGEWLKPVSEVLEAIGRKRWRRLGTGEDIEGLTEKGVPSFAPIRTAGSTSTTTTRRRTRSTRLTRSI